MRQDMTESQIRSLFNNTAAYEATKVITGDVPEISQFKKMLAPGTVLDVGCGCGWFAKKFKAYVGLDISEGMLRVAKGLNYGITLVQSGTLNLPFADNTFQGVLASQILPMLSYKDIPIASKEIFRVLKPKGHFLAVITEGDDVYNHGIVRDGVTEVSVSRYSVESAIQMFEEIGFTFLTGSRYPNVSVLSLFFQKPA